MPEVTVSMPAFNTEAYVGDAVRSVLAQRHVDFELIVVDDGSTDGTGSVVREIRDPRLTLVGNHRNRGIGFCHNLVLEMSDAPFIAHVDSDDLIRRVALSRMLRRLRHSSRIGQVYCNHYESPVDDWLDLADLRRQRRTLRELRPPRDVGRELIVHGMVANALRTYRREALEAVGPFNEDLQYAVDYEMTLRIAERFELALVPDFLYVQRLHGANVSHRGRFSRLRSWWRRARICLTLLRARGGRLLGRDRRQVYGLLGLGLLHATGIPGRLGARPDPGPRKARSRDEFAPSRARR